MSLLLKQITYGKHQIADEWLMLQSIALEVPGSNPSLIGIFFTLGYSPLWINLPRLSFEIILSDVIQFLF